MDSARGEAVKAGLALTPIRSYFLSHMNTGTPLMSATLSAPGLSATVAELADLVAERMAPATNLDVADEVERGLPLATVERIAQSLAPDDPNFVYRFVPRATLARRRAKSGGRLSTEESARVVRVAAVWSLARQVWHDEPAARRFLFTPHSLLNDRRPIDMVLASEFGRPLVEDILGGLAYGTAV